MLTINLLQALPKTPLWDRLKRDGRLLDDDARESNVVFLRPLRRGRGDVAPLIAYANDPEKLFARFRHQVDATYVNRKVTPAKGKLTWNEPARRRRDGVARAAAPLPAVGLPQAVLAHGQARAAARPDRRHDGRGVHGLPPDPVHPRGAARRPERLVLFGEEARRRRWRPPSRRPGRTSRSPRKPSRESEHRHATAVVSHQPVWRFRWPAATAIAFGN